MKITGDLMSGIHQGETLEIELQHLCRKFGNDFEINDLNLIIPSHSFTTFLGPSGCGKTTILRMIAGLEQPDSGRILFDQKPVFDDKQNINVPPQKRNLGFVFQDFALWPHMTVYENVAFPLRARNDNADFDRRVREALKIVRLDGMEKRKPDQLSGGQQQRVSLARAIVSKPSCILFDEPLSALDAILRIEMRDEIRRLTEQLQVTSVFVTHDQSEAMNLSDRIVVLRQGKVQQAGTPEETYKNPSNKFVAGFIGSSDWLGENSMVRPEDISLVPTEGAVSFHATLTDQRFMGSGYDLHLRVGDNIWLIHTPHRQSGDDVMIYIRPENIRKFETERA